MRKIPKLRFKEFNDEWEEKKLGDIGNKIILKNNSEKIKKVLTNSAEKGIVKQEDFFDKEITNEKNINNYYIVSKNDFVYNPRISKQAPYGPINKSNIDIGIVSPLYLVFNIKNENVDFLENYFKSSYWHRYMYNIGNSGARSDRMNIGMNDFFNMGINIPSLKEQQKIADFLSSVDKKISLTEQRLELFKEYKKGVMQKIFSQELRFKDSEGNDYPQWEEKRLGEILEEYNEKTTINNQYLTLSSTATGIYLQEEYFNRQIASANNIGYKILKKNQLVFSPQNLWLGNININTKYDIGIVSPSYKVFNLKNNILVNYFKNLIRTPKMLEEYKNASEQGASIVRRNLDMNQFNNICIQLPTLEEQQKIAEFLSSIDNKLECMERELEGLKEFKKGLLQQMFV